MCMATNATSVKIFVPLLPNEELVDQIQVGLYCNATLSIQGELTSIIEDVALTKTMSKLLPHLVQLKE